MIKNGLFLLFLFISCCVQAQQDSVLMYIDGKEVFRSEFDYFYKEDDSLIGKKSAPLTSYIDQFVNFKLKVAAAEATGLDTVFPFREKVLAYRRQLARSYLRNRIVTEFSARQLYDRMKDKHHAWRVQVSQIFKYLPQTISNHALQEVESRMDSIYRSLENKTTNFEACVASYSDEKRTLWINRLQMPTEFEDVAFALNKGDISRPFFTPMGIHMVKVLAREEIPLFETMKQELVNRHTRCFDIDEESKAFVEELKKEYKYTPNKMGLDELFASGTTEKTLFVLDGKKYLGKEFRRFEQTHSAGLDRLLEEFIMKSVLDYEDGRLEQKYPEFRLSMEKYHDDMLLLAITDKKLGMSAEDQEGLDNYFKHHRADYYWKTARYRGIVLHCTTKRIRKQVRKMLKALPEEEWQNAIRLLFNKEQTQVKFEYGLFAPGDNEYVDDFIFHKKRSTPLLSFPVTVLKGEKEKGPESYQEVGERLIGDYQRYLESRWVEQLRSKSKVEINQEVLKTVNNH